MLNSSLCQITAHKKYVGIVEFSGENLSVYVIGQIASNIAEHADELVESARSHNVVGGETILIEGAIEMILNG